VTNHTSARYDVTLVPSFWLIVRNRSKGG
jgi:hypothetical protein